MRCMGVALQIRVRKRHMIEEVLFTHWILTTACYTATNVFSSISMITRKTIEIHHACYTIRNVD